MPIWKNEEDMFALMKEKLYTPVVGNILDQMGYNHQFLPAVSRNRQNVLKPIDFVATLLEGEVKYQKLPSGNSEYIEFYEMERKYQ